MCKLFELRIRQIVADDMRDAIAKIVCLETSSMQSLQAGSTRARQLKQGVRCADDLGGRRTRMGQDNRRLGKLQAHHDLLELLM